VQPALEDRSNLAFCLVNFVLQLLLLTPDVTCLMEGADQAQSSCVDDRQQLPLQSLARLRCSTGV
jgi:hypothetical protein